MNAAKRFVIKAVPYVSILFAVTPRVVHIDFAIFQLLFHHVRLFSLRKKINTIFARKRKLGYITSWLGVSLPRQLIYSLYELWCWSEWGERVPFSAAIIYCLSVYSKHLSPLRSYSRCLAHYSWSPARYISTGLNIRKLFTYTQNGKAKFSQLFDFTPLLVMSSERHFSGLWLQLMSYTVRGQTH